MKKDHSAVKFIVSEELGEWMNCLYLKRNDGEDWHHQFIHHTENDGVGGITEILEAEGHSVLEQPQIKAMPPISFFKKLRLLKKFVELTKKVQIQWRTPRRDIRGIPETFILTLFSPSQTTALHERANEKGVSLNTWFLYNLDLATKDTLLLKSSERKWLLPINIRSRNEKLFGNHSASIVLNFFNEELSPKELHQKIKSYFKESLHWGSFLYSNMARFIGKKGTLRVAKNIKEVGTGVFSNLGTWPTEKVKLSDSAQLFNRRAVLAPVTQVLPIAATSWQWQDRLSLTLQLHPSLNRDAETVKVFMDAWCDHLGIKGETEQEVHQWSEFPECPREKVVPFP